MLAAGDLRSAQSANALEKLCQTYWYPLYAYVRRRGFAQHEAEDLTQEFFARFLAGDSVAKADPAKGRFRFYLLAALNHFLSDAWDHARRMKRAGNLHTVSIDVQVGEERFRLEPCHDWSPDRLYERRWALTVLEKVLTQLEHEYETRGKARLCQSLKPLLTGDEAGHSYAEIARELGIHEGALRVAVHRMRQRYGELFRMEVAQTVSRPEEVAEEMRHLLAVLSAS
ncbi:MAG TPA: sigma-70 family RNA polymerase sigma factor [Candidatus Paceibacterota bacterium]|nr:sigma-70 family RNA polymerase sigma factor [Candidatus Paceibacterota bacterium]HSA01935.1 sigma-70 family RNA polymerase sigma factor [Candidatus Paceibacterota bacterium]